MPEIIIEQALFSRGPDGTCTCLARSPAFSDGWLLDAERLCRGFGERLDGATCPEAVFARPLDKQHVAVVQAADAGQTGTPELAFRLLVVSRPDYCDLAGDPFLIAERFPAPWAGRGELPSLTWPAEAPPPRRTVEHVREVLRSPEGPALLGTVQALVDGGHVAFVRPQPGDLMRRLWMLLPTATRCDLWPASFSFGNALGFDALVVPRAVGEGFTHYLSEQQVENYPEGRYELGLQMAAEQGDQRELDRLFARRSRAQMWKLGVTLLVVTVVLALASGLLGTLSTPKHTAPAQTHSNATQEKHQP